MPPLLSIAEARAAVQAAVGTLDSERVAVPDALGRVLAEPVVAAHDVPPFANAAMDGFALRPSPAGTTLRIAGESRAGAPAAITLEDGQAIRISTGDELVPPGTVLQSGQIHDSNAITLAALARATGAEVGPTANAGDTREATERTLAHALEDADVLVVSGGVSVGPHDHVKPALEALGVEQRFWRVALRPGKPTWFGTRDGKLVFGLPGNPVSAMVTFHLFAKPALLALQGAPFAPGRTRAAKLARTISRSPERDEAVRVRLDGDSATPTGPQGSHVLTSMLGADGLAIITAGEGDVEAGTQVTVELLST